MSASRLDPADLRRRCDPSQFSFTTTGELSGTSQLAGQSRAENALRFAVSIPHDGYNAFVLGRPGVGRRTLARRLLEDAARERPRADDWCYINNFACPEQPIALRLPNGRGPQLCKDMAGWVEGLRSTVPAAFETSEYRAQRERIETELTERQTRALESLDEEAAGDGIALIRTPAGFSLAPLQGGEVMPPEAYGKLPEDDRKAITAKISRYEERLASLMRDMMQWRRERLDRIRALNREVIQFAVSSVTEEIRQAYSDLPEVQAYIDAARAHVMENGDAFRKTEQNPSVELPLLMGQADDFRRYQVNVLVHQEAAAGAPVEMEDNPTCSNLIGRIEHLAQFGALSTDFNLIRPGALHRANGGYLVVDALKLLSQPFAWEGLKRALTSREIRIEPPERIFSVISTRSLEPQPIPLSVKVILYGTPELYYLLESLDPEFPALFKVAADFEDDMAWTPQNADAIARLLAAIAGRHRLQPLTAGAVAAVVERAARLSEDTAKLSLHMSSIEELAIEADHFSRQAGRALTEAQDVEAAVAAQRSRTDRLKERTGEAIQRNIILIDTEGAAIARVNGLAVYSVGKSRFAQPARISATARIGKGEVIDIQREAKLGGAIHSKGVLILSAFLATRFARSHSLSVTVTLAFEQTYGEVEGDSASVAELCALLSSLADLPIRQDLALEETFNQFGDVQAIGAVNEKIEGFFELCNARRLTGTHGVLIPVANRQHLMLRDDVVEAVRRGDFHVYAMNHVDDAIELLTGMPAGAQSVTGDFPAASVNGQVAARLAQFSDRSQAGGAEQRRQRLLHLSSGPKS